MNEFEVLKELPKHDTEIPSKQIFGKSGPVDLLDAELSQPLIL